MRPFTLLALFLGGCPGSDAEDAAEKHANDCDAEQALVMLARFRAQQIDIGACIEGADCETLRGETDFGRQESISSLDEFLCCVQRARGGDWEPLDELLDPSLFEDLVGDQIDSVSSRDPVRHPWNDIVEWAGYTTQIGEGPAESLFGPDGLYDCGAELGGGQVACGENPLPFLAGEVMVFEFALDGSTRDGDQPRIDSVVLQGSSSTTDDWVPQGDFDFDYFQGTDTWVQAHRDDPQSPGGSFLILSNVDDQQQVTTSDTAARALLGLTSVTFFVPAAEIEVDSPFYRMSAFTHDGNFGEATRGGDVTGSDPTEPLTQNVQVIHFGGQ